MKRLVLFATLLVLTTANVFGQEIMINGIVDKKFNGIISGGEMEQYMYIATFIKPVEGKKNFLISHISPHSLTEEQKVELELPDSYVLKTSSFTMNSHLLIFYDENKKEDVFITVEGVNINKKKTSKHSNDTYIAINSNNQEGFVYAAIDKKGNYKLKMVDKALEKVWEKSFSSPSGTSWDILSIKGEVDGIAILRKENKSGNKYAFTKQVIDPIEGNELFTKTISAEDLNPYPTFISSKEGMVVSGGYYYNDGVYTGKPDGVYMAMLGPDYTIEQFTKVPFSQIIEDVKSTIGNKLLNDNVSVSFLDGYIAHETQSFVMIGQLFTHKKTESGIEVKTGEIITVELGMDQQRVQATASKIDEQTLQLNGNFDGVNNLDLGIWLKNANLFPYKLSLPSVGYPMIGYKTKNEGEPTSLCFKNVGIKQDTANKACEHITKFEQKKTAYTFNGVNTPDYPAFTSGIITDPMNVMSVTSYELDKSTLYLFKMQMPNLEGITINREPQEDMPEEPEPVQEDVEENQIEE